MSESVCACLCCLCLHIPANNFPSPLPFRFMDKIYILSSQEALGKFMLNPRRYLLPPMPRPPCKVSVIGPPCAGKSTLCALLAQHYGAEVVDMEVLMKPVIAKVKQDMLEKVKRDSTLMAIERVKVKMELDATHGSSE